MNRKRLTTLLGALLLLMAGSCSRKERASNLIVEIPQGFSGNFSLQMGVQGAPPLVRDGEAYRLTLSQGATASTSTLLIDAQPLFRNASDGAIWGYSHKVFRAGDGLPVGGKIEFFVGTRKEFEAEESRRNHSEGFRAPLEWSKTKA
ncbi:MAG TPA: hypothetical protein VMG31_01435 [Verrucomicrobiae bacterium]|nr:hypothetical protein [Verrucomicrobiae bacterium]